MSTAEAIHICDSQYNPSQVHSTFNIVVSNTQEATARTVPATAAQILHKYDLFAGWCCCCLQEQLPTVGICCDLRDSHTFVNTPCPVLVPSRVPLSALVWLLSVVQFDLYARYLLSMGETSGLVCPLSVDWEKHANVQEVCVC